MTHQQQQTDLATPYNPQQRQQAYSPPERGSTPEKRPEALLADVFEEVDAEDGVDGREQREEHVGVGHGGEGVDERGHDAAHASDALEETEHAKGARKLERRPA
eukprot:2288393-Rhodomonas_salina.1